jgi:hypothetical protein
MEKHPAFQIVQEHLQEADCTLDAWPAQMEFLTAEDPVIGMFTGAGYGKTRTLCWRGTIDHTKQDFWWDRCDDWRANPLHFIYGAPTSRYIVDRLAPEQLGVIARWEAAIGRPLTKPTGRGRDGYFDSQQKRRLEMANGVTIHFHGLDKEESAVATDAAGLYVDEATMMQVQGIWTRATMRVRDARALSRTIACTGTPELGHFLREEFFDPLTGKVREGYRVFEDATLNNPVTPPEFFKRYRNVSEVFVDMQVFGKWTQGQGGERFAHLFRPEAHLRPMNIAFQQPGVQFDIGWDPGYATGQVVIMYYKASMNKWFVVHEIPIVNEDTRTIARRIRDLGVHARYGNLRMIGLDPNDAKKRKSNGVVTDAQIIYEELGVRPKFYDVHGFNAELRTRNDVLANMLIENRIVFNDTMTPTHRRQPGCINSILNYSLKEADREDDAKFLDHPTAATKKLWKHAIDAIHYVLMHYETTVYRRVRMGVDRDKIEARRASSRQRAATKGDK